jgi:hypothetical protein
MKFKQFTSKDKAKNMENCNIITFFMIVTNKDILIAQFAIAGYQKLFLKYGKNLPFELLIYANCLDDAIKFQYFTKWKQYRFIKIFDNKEKTKSISLIPGETIVSPEGVSTIREGKYEHCDEIWTSELPKIATPYFATVDADFEILQPDFIFRMIEMLKLNSNAIGISTDYTPIQQNCYDSYTNRYINLQARWHTWFCIYKREANQCDISHFLYEEKNRAGETNCHDSSGYYQNKLIENFGFKFLTVGQKYQPQFIHYGAFSKNRSITNGSIWLYRMLAIASKRGLDEFHRLKMGDCIANKAVKLVARVLKKCFFNEKERGYFSFNLKN